MLLETTEDEAAGGAHEHLFKSAADRPLTRRYPGRSTLVESLINKRQHARFAILRERVQVEHLVVGGVGSTLKSPV